MSDFLLDIQRATLLLWVSLKFSIGPILRYILRLPAQGDNPAVRMRLAMEELGLTYLKLGQFLATRYDILPEEVCRELNKLFEDVSPMAFEDVKAVIEAELGGPLEEFFPAFNRQPIGAASVAQVHEAWTDKGERVAVKVQRPGIERVFVADMHIVRRIAMSIDALHLLGNLSATEIADEFATWTRREMNFLIEGRTADRLRISALPFEIVPKIYWELTTPKLLTMEFVEGISLAQISNLLEEGGIELVHAQIPDFDLGQTVHNLSFASLHQLFGIGFFHGDPHPGNILIRYDNAVAFIDFGIFGALTEYELEVVTGLAENIAVGNIEESFRYYAKQLTPTEDTDLRAFEQEARVVLRQWYQASLKADPATSALPIKDRHLGRYIGEMIAVSRRNRLRMGRRYLLFWRALNALDATILRLSAEYDLVSEMRRFFEQIRPSLVQRVLQVVRDPSRAALVADLVRRSPNYFTDLLNDVAQGQYEWRVQAQSPREVRRARDRDTKWLTAAVLALALTVLATAVPLDALARPIILVMAMLLYGVLIVFNAVARWR